MLMSAKYKHCFWKRLYEDVDELYVAKMEKTYCSHTIWKFSFLTMNVLAFHIASCVHAPQNMDVWGVNGFVHTHKKEGPLLIDGES